MARAVAFVAASSQYASNAAPFDYNAAYSVLVHAYLDTADGNEYVIGIGASGTNHDSVRFHSSNYLAAICEASGARTQVDGSTITTGWHQVAFVRVDNATLLLYVDGVLEATNTRSVAGRGLSATDLWFGRAWDSSGFYSNQDQYAAKAFTRALSLPEIIREFATVTAASGSSLWGVWPELDTDISGNGNTLTHQGSPSLADPLAVAWGSQGPIFLEDVAANVSVTPTTLALVIAPFAPTVSAKADVSVTPTTLALVIAPFAPTVTATASVSVTPTTLALTTTPFAPTVTTTANVTVTPTTLALAIAPFAPTVTASGGVSVTPTTLALTTTPFAPTVTASGGVSVTPATLALAVAPFEPTVSATANVSVTPATLALTIDLRVGFSGPTVTVSDHQSVTPATLALVIAPFAPTVTATGGVTVTPTTLALTLTGYAPTVAVPGEVTPTTLALTLTGYAPTVFNTYAPTIVDTVTYPVQLQKDWLNIVGSSVGIETEFTRNAEGGMRSYVVPVFGAGTAALPSVALSTTGVGIFSGGTGATEYLGLSANGTEQLRVVGGKVLIGTTTNRVGTLQILGNIEMRNVDTDLTNKTLQILGGNYTSANTPYCYVAGTSASGFVSLAIGGGNGTYNACTIGTLVAGATTSTLGGTVMARWTTAGVRIQSGASAAAATALHVVAAAALPVLTIEQLDADEPFINYVGTETANAASSLSSWTSGSTVNGHIRIAVNGTDRWVETKTAPTS